MVYKNARGVLPDALIEEIQKYVDGESIYIPAKTEEKANAGCTPWECSPRFCVHMLYLGSRPSPKMRIISRVRLTPSSAASGGRAFRSNQPAMASSS